MIYGNLEDPELVDDEEVEEFNNLLVEQIELETTSQLESWEREFCKIENIGKMRLFGIPYSQPEITREVIRREFIDFIGPSWDDTHAGDDL